MVYYEGATVVNQCVRRFNSKFEWIRIACWRRLDSRARRSVGSELNCTPGKKGERGGARVKERL